MIQQLEERLGELKAQYASGQKELADLENKQAAIRSLLLRLKQAIKVLEEEIAKENSSK